MLVGTGNNEAGQILAFENLAQVRQALSPNASHLLTPPRRVAVNFS
jgi:hypothetical protein